MVRWWRHWRSRGVVIGVSLRWNLDMLEVHTEVTYEGRSVWASNLWRYDLWQAFSMMNEWLYTEPLWRPYKRHGHVLIEIPPDIETIGVQNICELFKSFLG
jgi:hypothetical protein